MNATTHQVVRDRPLLAVPPGATLSLLVLAASDRHCAGIDLDTGALVRAWSPAPSERPRQYDVVEVTAATDPDAVPDPSQPEALAVDGPPRPVGRLTGRRAERLVRAVLHPPGRPLLGGAPTAIPFWQRSAGHPSVAVVEPPGTLCFMRSGSYLGCRFTWQGHERELPCLDRALAGYMDRTGRARLQAGRGDRIVVCITAPIEGRCHKVVESLLRRP